MPGVYVYRGTVVTRVPFVARRMEPPLRPPRELTAAAALVLLNLAPVDGRRSERYTCGLREPKHLG